MKSGTFSSKPLNKSLTVGLKRNDRGFCQGHSEIDVGQVLGDLDLVEEGLVEGRVLVQLNVVFLHERLHDKIGNLVQRVFFKSLPYRST